MYTHTNGYFTPWTIVRINNLSLVTEITIKGYNNPIPRLFPGREEPGYESITAACCLFLNATPGNIVHYSCFTVKPHGYEHQKTNFASYYEQLAIFSDFYILSSM